MWFNEEVINNIGVVFSKMKYGMKPVVWIVCWMTIILNCLGLKTDVIDCTNDELVTSIFNDPIDLTMRGVIKIYENVTINEILTTTNNEFELNYIDARLENSNISKAKNLKLFTTEHFENYAKEQTAARISLKINLGCGMGKERVVIFFQPLKEGNYFSPTFSQRFYELIVPTPIYAGFALTAFLEIAATDNDLTHNQILFTSNDSLQHYIRVGTKNVTSHEKKTYFASLILEKILLELPQPLEFEIVATDNGVPPKSSKASVMIRSDPKRSLPPKPRFLQLLYKGFVNIDFHMEPIQIRLSNGTYTPEVEFSLNGVDKQSFHLQDNKNGSINIIWNINNLNKSDILQHKSWELEVKAKHKDLADVGRTNILVEMADVKKHFHFMSSFYEGNIDEMGELHINPIIFNPYTYQPNVEFSVTSLHNFFYLSIQNFSIELQLNKNFTLQAIDDIGYLKLTLQASWESLSSTTNIVIKLPQIKNETSRQMFQFEKPIYLGQLNETYDLELETIVLKTDVFNTLQIEYNLSGNDSDQFYMMQNKNRIQIQTIFNLLPQRKVHLKNFYLLNLEAKHNDIKTFAHVFINVPGNNKEIKKNVFLTPLVIGSLLISNATQQLSIESVSVANDLEDKFGELKFRLRGDHSLHFEVKENLKNHTIDIALKSPLSSIVLATKHLLNVTLQAILFESTGFEWNDTLMVFIKLPKKECPTSLTPLQGPPQFSSSTYIFTIFTNQTGILGVVNAFSEGNNAKLHYTLDVKNDVLAQRLSINPFTGELTLYGIIEEGNYPFNITAENIDTRELTVVKALLKVQQKEECKLFEGVSVEKTLMILHVDEEKPNYGLLDMKFNENCTFHIEEMWPNDKDAIPIDREDDIFQNIEEPQIKVKLRLKCDTKKYQRNLTIEIPKPDEKRASQITFTEDIPYAPDIMWLYIIIDDINDNPPEFTKSEGPIYLGYPSGNVDLDIYPEYLTQIKAYDKDLGLNAKILFTMRDNPYFDIEPNTGKIYPKGKILGKNEQTELIILATDQYGEGLTSATVVVVKGLSSDFYSVITLKTESAKTKQEIENELSQEMGFNINVLKMSYVPQLLQQRSNMNQSLSCKAWIYAYHKHQLVTYKEMQEQILVKSPEANIVNMQTYEEATRRLPPLDNDNLSYLIVTILLSLISCSFLMFIIWRFYCKPSQTIKCDTKSSTLIDSHNENGQQQICAESSHGSDNAKDCAECNNNDNNHVKFNDPIENATVDKARLK